MLFAVTLVMAYEHNIAVKYFDLFPAEYMHTYPCVRTYIQTRTLHNIDIHYWTASSPQERVAGPSNGQHS